MVTARAVVVYGGDGTQNTAAPADDPGWSNVGTIGGTSGVYIGSYETGYWVLTATHVGIGDIVLNGSTYTAVSGSGVQIAGDLYAFRITTDPLLPNLTLSSVRPPDNASVTLIGNGVNRASALTTWYVNKSNSENWVWSTSYTLGSIPYTGYAYAGGQALRWGTNFIEGVYSYNVGTGVTSGLGMSFNAITGEGQGAPGDSGGALFYKNGGTWELAGILSAIATFNAENDSGHTEGSPNHQPGSTAVLGNATFAINLADYVDLIYTQTGAAIPEPATWAALLGGAALVGALVQRRRRSRN